LPHTAQVTAGSRGFLLTRATSKNVCQVIDERPNLTPKITEIDGTLVGVPRLPPVAGRYCRIACRWLYSLGYNFEPGKVLSTAFSEELDDVVILKNVVFVWRKWQV
jgi:hypothetical protein